MKKKLSITLEEYEYSALCRLAIKETRTPTMQVRFMLKAHLAESEPVQSKAKILAFRRKA